MIWQPGADRPMTEEQVAQWRGRIDRATHLRKAQEPTWDKALKRYTDSKADQRDVNPLLEVRHVESKKAQLFYQTPEVQLHPIDPQNPELPIEPLLPLRQKVLNDRLGPDGTDVKRTVHEALFDCLAPAGLLVTEIGFDVRTVSLDQPLQPADSEQPTQEGQEPTQDGQAAQPEAVPQVSEIPVWGKAFWERVSPKKVLIDAEWRSTRYDQAPWLGLTLQMPLARAKREFKLPEDFKASASADRHAFEYTDQPTHDAEPMVEYHKIWYRAEVFDPDVINPELYRLLILVDGYDQPVKHKDSPFQALDEMGLLTPESMRGNPIHLGTLRDLSDSAYVPSDLAVFEQLSAELTKYRSGLIRNRNARTPINMIDPQGFPVDEIEKIKQGEKNVFTNPGILIAGQMPIQTANPGQEPRDNFTSQEIIERDVQLAMGTNDTQSGVLQKQSRTATEVRASQGGASARTEAEKDRLREWFIAGVRKFDSVLQWTMTPKDLQLILGSQGATLWEQWRQLPGCYAYKILPDSGVHVDAAQFRAQKIDEYNMLRKDPQVNATELLRTVARALGYDPAKMVMEQAPEQGPEPIKTSFAFKGEDLIGPQSQAVVEILAQMGITISPAAITTLMAAQMQQQQAIAAGEMTPDGKPIGDSSAKHPGTATPTEPISKHQRDRTAGVKGVGVAA